LNGIQTDLTRVEGNLKLRKTVVLSFRVDTILLAGREASLQRFSYDIPVKASSCQA
jgi:hypothetical protein